MCYTSRLLGACLIFCGAAALFTATAAAEDYFRGKTINMFVAGSPGDGYDGYGRLLAAHSRQSVDRRP